MVLADLLQKKKVVLFDGAMGTELARRGQDTGGALNLSSPGDILDIHREYVRVGVDIITTNTFTMNRISIETRRLSVDLQEANMAGVRLAREAAAGKDKLVFGDLGPTGKLLEPYGTYSEEQFYDTFREQALSLAEGGADGLIVETMTDLREALCALKACKDATDLPVIVTLSYATTDKGGRTIMGNTVKEAVLALEESGADAVGANCGVLSPEEMAQIAALYKEHTALPVLIQPNAGKPKLVEGKAVYDMTPEDFAGGMVKCIESGASLVGGCCGTTLDHIRALVKRVE